MKDAQEKNLDWGAFDERLARRGLSIWAWAEQHGFKRKTVYALRKGQITWGYGPKVMAIVHQALKEGLVDEVEESCV
ncbi:hypothetical protein [Geoalkalibacter sp.]|uniref:hypothetical protein n=1 Tax=Geoalkalibacter sp. TaxID=3041440 RepID=UPI00272E58DA|nr:hypothetical protein [Geoalkalibacter sp.]